jgi:hypothetical protein
MDDLAGGKAGATFMSEDKISKGRDALNAEMVSALGQEPEEFNLTRG